MFVTNYYNFLVFMQNIEVFPTGLCFGNGRAKSSFKYEFLFIFLKHNCFCALAAWQVGGGSKGSGAEDRDMSAQGWPGAEQRGASVGSGSLPGRLPWSAASIWQCWSVLKPSRETSMGLHSPGAISESIGPFPISRAVHPGLRGELG